mmetsp:Transcript_20898/g.33455  ORF Transcript_20898/g.33455 Transcript_20898/m.33455 type:complete len:244 (+) Transcript_20898:262-993(+)
MQCPQKFFVVNLSIVIPVGRHHAVSNPNRQIAQMRLCGGSLQTRLLGHVEIHRLKLIQRLFANLEMFRIDHHGQHTLDLRLGDMTIAITVQACKRIPQSLVDAHQTLIRKRSEQRIKIDALLLVPIERLKYRVNLIVFKAVIVLAHHLLELLQCECAFARRVKLAPCLFQLLHLMLVNLVHKQFGNHHSKLTLSVKLAQRIHNGRRQLLAVCNRRKIFMRQTLRRSQSSRQIFDQHFRNEIFE